MRLLILSLSFFLYFEQALAIQPSTEYNYAITISGEPELPRDFTHFPYVNPEAPKGGTLHLYSIGKFDNINPFSIKGHLPEGYNLTHDSLLISSLDEPTTGYGLIADSFSLAPDRSWVAFSINPKARFHDGSPITAHDVLFSYEISLQNFGSIVQKFFSDITDVHILDDYHIRFDLAPTASRELPLHIGRFPIFSKSFWEKQDIDKTGIYPFIGSGAYRIDFSKTQEGGQHIVYQRVENYWAKDLPTVRGHYNFDSVQYDYYRDSNVALEAFRAGLYDIREEHSAKVWNTLYTGSLFDNGTLVKEYFSHNRPLGMEGFFFNTRRKLFKDIRIRQALILAFDFEWTNRQYFRNTYARTTSYFFNTDLASFGLPSKEEQELLKPYSDSLPQDLFTRTYHFPTSDASGYNRDNLIKAAKLLEEAGWQMQEGKRVNAKGETLRFQLLVDSQSMRKIALPFAENLRKLGIEMTILMPDRALFIRRLQEYDYDMIASGIGSIHTPGGELRLSWHSSSLEPHAGRNLSGASLPILDYLIEKIVHASNRQELQITCRAFDRVLLWQDYVIPLGASNQFRVAYKSHLAKPEISPKGRIGLWTWWVKTPPIAKKKLGE